MTGYWRPLELIFLLGASAFANAFSADHQASGYGVNIDEGEHVADFTFQGCLLPLATSLCMAVDSMSGCVQNRRKHFKPAHMHPVPTLETTSLGPLHRLNVVSFFCRCALYRAHLALQGVMSPAGGSRVSQGCQLWFTLLCAVDAGVKYQGSGS